MKRFENEYIWDKTKYILTNKSYNCIDCCFYDKSDLACSALRTNTKFDIFDCINNGVFKNVF